MAPHGISIFKPGIRQHGPSNTIKLGLYTAIGIPDLYDQDDPTTDDWPEEDTGIVPVNLGAGWQHYRDAVLARGVSADDIIYSYNEHGRTIMFQGAGAEHFLSLFDEVIFSNGAPPKVIERIKRKSNVGTKVRLWCMSDRVSTGPVQHSFDNNFRAADMPYLLVGTAKNLGGLCTADTTVDPEEGTAWRANEIACVADESARPGNGSGHSWMLDMRNTSLHVQDLATGVQQWDEYYSLYPFTINGRVEYGIDGFHSDNISTQYSPALATNEPTITDAVWAAACRTKIGTWRSAARSFWIPDAVYNTNPRRYDELYNDLRNVSSNVGDMTRAEYMASTVKYQYWEHNIVTGDGATSFTNKEICDGLVAARRAGVETVYFASRTVAGQIPTPLIVNDDPLWREIRTLLNGDARGLKFILFVHMGEPRSLLYWGPECRPLI